MKVDRGDPAGREREALPRLETARLVLTIPPPEAAPAVLAYTTANLAHHAPYAPPLPEGATTEAYWRERLARHVADYVTDAALRLYLFRREAPADVVGQVSFTQIFRGPLQRCILGYALDHRAVGQGLMHEALVAAIGHVFGPMGLHRIEANYLPTNERSGRLLRRLGFVVEGYARDYLFVGGAWRDHILTSLTNPISPGV